MVTKSKNVESQDVDLSLIDPSPLNRRNREALEAGTAAGLKETIASVKSFGVLQDIGLRPLDGGRFEIIWGERRFWAAKHAGRKTIPAKIKQLSDKDAHLQRIDENLLREQLDPWEFAQTLEDLATMMGSQRLAAARLAKTEDWYSVQVAPLKCPQFEAEIRSGAFTPTHARAATKWMKYPEIAAAIRQEWDKASGYQAAISAAYWTQLVGNAVYKHSRDFDPLCPWHAKNKKALDVHKLDEQERCFNVELWDKLATEHRKAELEKDREEPDPDPAPGKAETYPPEWARLNFLRSWFCRAIAKKLEPARCRPKLFALVPVMMAGSEIGDLASLALALSKYYGDPGLRTEPSFQKVLDQSQHKSRANDAGLADWLLEFIRTAEPWSAHDGARVAAALGIDFATEWDRETCIDELARCYDLLPEDLRKIRGRYLPGLRPQDLLSLLK